MGVGLFGNGFSIVKAAYNALLIDYRLLCCLLFPEHSLELTEVRTNRQIHEIFDPDANEALMHDSFASVDVEISHSSGYGCFWSHLNSYPNCRWSSIRRLCR